MYCFFKISKGEQNMHGIFSILQIVDCSQNISFVFLFDRKRNTGDLTGYGSRDQEEQVEGCELTYLFLVRLALLTSTPPLCRSVFLSHALKQWLMNILPDRDFHNFRKED